MTFYDMSRINPSIFQIFDRKFCVMENKVDGSPAIVMMASLAKLLGYVVWLEI